MTPVRYIKGDATSPQAKGPKVIAHICNDVSGRPLFVAADRPTTAYDSD
jgi:hypothetical protein